MSRPQVRVVSFKPVQRNTLRGFATVEFGSLRIIDCSVHEHVTSGRCWVSLPGKPVLDDQGRINATDRGKLAYSPTAEWTNRNASDRFSQLVIAELRRDWPEAFTNGAAR